MLTLTNIYPRNSQLILLTKLTVKYFFNFCTNVYLKLGNTTKRLIDRGIGDGRVNQYYREGYTQELEKELKTLKQKMGGQTKAIQTKNAKIEELKVNLKKNIFDLKTLKSKSYQKNIIKSHLDKHCTAAQTRKLLNPDFNHQRKYEESDFILAAALKSMSPEAYRLIRYLCNIYHCFIYIT